MNDMYTLEALASEECHCLSHMQRTHSYLAESFSLADVLCVQHSNES